MILRWKVLTATEQVAKWQGHSLSFTYVPELHRWCVFVDGQRCKDRWLTPRAAQEAIDARMEVMIVNLSPGVQAKQRPLSGQSGLVVRHGA
jgi:hypothetical protein